MRKLSRAPQALLKVSCWLASVRAGTAPHSQLLLAPGFFSDPSIKKAWCGADWAGDTQGQLDPTKEAQAAKLRVEEGFSTRDREAAELTGMSFDVIMSQRKREERLMQESGIKPVSPVAPVSPVQTPDTDNDDDTEDDSDDKPRK